jgi:hypothetical protein
MWDTGTPTTPLPLNAIRIYPHRPQLGGETFSPLFSSLSPLLCGFLR